ncbi:MULTISPECIES: DAK2 domain-containing protein [Arthrobacter]|uniref:DAK2 domain-containing protein n=2 Tax=Arthrobacter TaxID=1663 RepID=A0ABU9KF84_9MICC|nr:DAK2 domain-containing protein [Arthrobacter sp. YJM1]MDP5225547.1 DAK2 domain-containing protein [Arthrobacter sp. YJM1]
MRRWLCAAERVVGNHSDRLNAINIFPVADGDTGTNLYLTLRAAARAIDTPEYEAGTDVGTILADAAGAAMENARGNSGTLLAVFLAALGEALQGQNRLSAPLFATGLRRARMRCWSALSEPVEGTMLSALAAAAEAADDIDSALNGDDSNQALAQSLNHVVETVRAAVVHTEEQLSPLTQAKVVDAGAVGLLLVLDCLRETILGDPASESSWDELHGYRSEYPHIHGDMPSDDGYEVMCTIELSPLDAATLRQRLDEIGESVIISPVKAVTGPQSGDDVQEGELSYRWRVHVHIADPAPALELLNALGAPANVTLSELAAPRET